MKTKQQPKSALSRRDFLKTTTAATAAASVGIAPSLADDSTYAQAPPRLVQWRITDQQIVTLWTEIWPKIVALAWLNPVIAGNPYRTLFEDNEAFRIQEAIRIAGIIGVNYASTIPILITHPRNLGIPIANYFTLFKEREKINLGGWCPTNPYGDTYFIINKEGIIMPWPDIPTADDTFVGYFQGGGVLPRVGPPWPVGGAEETLFNQLLTIPNPPPDPTQTPMDPKGLSGIALITLFEKWPKMIALAWHDPGEILDITTYPRKYIMPEVWSKWPAYVTETVVNRNDFLLEHDLPGSVINLEVPLPDPGPATTNNIFKELIIGYASNPMYSNCY